MLAAASIVYLPLHDQLLHNVAIASLRINGHCQSSDDSQFSLSLSLSLSLSFSLSLSLSLSL